MVMENFKFLFVNQIISMFYAFLKMHDISNFGVNFQTVQCCYLNLNEYLSVSTERLSIGNQMIV